MSLFTDFRLHEKIEETLHSIQYHTPTSIQTLVIPKVLEGKDIIASAQTGTGKTAAFMLPTLHMLSTNSKESAKQAKPRVLVLVPTRELAMQVHQASQKYGKMLKGVRTACIYGGVPYPVQRKQLAKCYDILIATPGRLIDQLERQKVDLSHVELLILDEADRMLDMGFSEDVEFITNACPAERQTLFFSATIDGSILPFSKKLQNNPIEIKDPFDARLEGNIEQQLYYADNLKHKRLLLAHILENTSMKQAIIFTSTKMEADELALHLEEQGHRAKALHGDMHQRQRTKTIDKLRRGAIDILVATDVAARGIDIAALSLVINYDLPYRTEDFVHRVGRTGRAGAKGIAITFVTRREEKYIKKINSFFDTQLPVCTIKGLEPKEQSREQPKRRNNNRRGYNNNKRSNGNSNNRFFAKRKRMAKRA